MENTGQGQCHRISTWRSDTVQERRYLERTSLAKGQGTSENPIVIQAYGDGEARPIINGVGRAVTAGELEENVDGKGTAFFLYNQSYWEVNDLEITNHGEDNADAHRTGVKILGKDAGTISHIYLKKLYVHDVNGGYSDRFKRSGGIQMNIIGDTEKTKFDDVLIDGCTVEDVVRTGIQVGVSSWRNRMSYKSGKGEWYPSTNVVVRNCVVNRIGGDGILVRECEKPLVEYNYASDCNKDGSAANVAIWPWNSDDAVLQYNEACNTRSTLDGQGFDCDYLCNNTIIQYNYSHNNEGGFLLVCSPDSSQKNLNNVIRYNISENDCERVIKIDGPGTVNTKIYNNVLYLDESMKGKVAQMLYHQEWGGYNRDTYYYNNIFYNKADATYDLRYSANTVFENNCFIGGPLPEDSYQVIFADSNLIAHDGDKIFAESQDGHTPGSGANHISFTDPSRLSGYKLAENSICINAGRKVKDHGGKDFWGNPLYYGAPDIGAFESPAGGTLDMTEETEVQSTKYRFEIEDLIGTNSIQASPASVTEQIDDGFSNAKGALFNAKQAGDSIEIKVNVPEAGLYQICVGTKNVYNRGKYISYVNGTRLGGERDAYSDASVFPVETIGTAVLATGESVFRFEVTGKNAKSSGYALAFDFLELISLGGGKYECEDIRSTDVKVIGGDRVQYTDPVASNGKADSFNCPSFNNDERYIEYTLHDLKAGTYTLKVAAISNFNKGMYELYVNDSRQGTPQDLYSASKEYPVHNFGTVTFEQDGDQKIRFQVSGKNEKSTEYNLMFDYIQVEPAAEKTLLTLQVEAPAKTIYRIGESLDLTGLKVYAIYSNGEIETLTAQQYTVSEFDSSSSGEKSVTISYGGKRASFTVSVRAAGRYECEELPGTTNKVRKVYEKSKASAGKVDGLESSENGAYVEYTISGIGAGTYQLTVGAVSNTNKEMYQLCVNGQDQGEVQDLYSQGEKFPTHDLGTVTFSKSGNQTFRFNVVGKNPSATDNGYSLMLDYIQLDPLGPVEPVDPVDPADPVASTSIYECENLDGVVDGDGETIPYSYRKQYSYSSASNGATDSLQFEYEQDANGVNIVVDRTGSYVEYTVPVAKAGTYKVTVVSRGIWNKGMYQLYVNGEKPGEAQDQYAPQETYMNHELGEVTFSETGNQKFKFVIVGKNEKSQDYALMFDYIRLDYLQAKPITLEHIEITAPNKTEYHVGDELDTAGMTVTAFYSDGSSKAIAIGDCRISGFDSAVVGKQTVTVSYEDKSATFQVVVKEKDKDVVPGNTGNRKDPEKPRYPSKNFADVEENAWYHAGVDFMVKNGFMDGVSDNKFDVDGNLTRAQLVTILYRIAGEPKSNAMNPFADVAEGQWYTDAVTWAAENGIIKGIDATTFAPNAEISREQIAAILFRYTKAEKTASRLAGFPDVEKVSDYAVEAMAWAVEQGLINGISESDGKTYLAPQETATRAQIAVILMRYLTSAN